MRLAAAVGAGASNMTILFDRDKELHQAARLTEQGEALFSASASAPAIAALLTNDPKGPPRSTAGPPSGQVDVDRQERGRGGLD
jgi:hypothetical protein